MTHAPWFGSINAQDVITEHTNAGKTRCFVPLLTKNVGAIIVHDHQGGGGTESDIDDILTLSKELYTILRVCVSPSKTTKWLEDLWKTESSKCSRPTTMLTSGWSGMFLRFIVPCVDPCFTSCDEPIIDFDPPSCETTGEFIRD